MKEGILDQSRLRNLVSEMEAICKRNQWPVVALSIIGSSEKKGVALLRMNPNDAEHQAAMVEYPLVGDLMIGAATIYEAKKGKAPTG